MPQRWVITKVRAQDGVSGGAGAHRPRAGGCARSQLCRRSGRNRSCSRSAHSCTAARAGSALGTHLCLEVEMGVTGVDLARAPEPCSPLASGPAGLGPQSGSVPLASSPRPGLPTQRAREASSWKPPGHSHTAPPGRGTQRPLTQRHSSESSSELSSSEPPGRTQTSSLPPVMAPPGLCPLLLHSPLGGFPSSRGLESQKELLSLCDVRHWDPGRGQSVISVVDAPGSLSHTPSDPTLPLLAHQHRAADTGGIGRPNRGPGDSSSRQR